MPAYDMTLKCSHIFNTLDARGAISVTERVGVIKRIRDLAVRCAAQYLEARREVLKGESIDAEALIATLDDAPQGRRVIENFFRHVVGAPATRERASREMRETRETPAADLAPSTAPSPDRSV